MSGIVSELARVTDAFDRPTLRLLEYKWAPQAITILRSTFSRERRTIPADRLYAHIDTQLAELAAAGHTVPTDTGRNLALTWMRQQWLTRTPGTDGEEYSLTSHALEALEMVASMSRDRALLSESRLATILTAARRCALEASPDTSRRLALVDAQIAELTAQRARIASGIDAGMSTDRLLDAVASLQDLVGQLPGDFKRVEESLRGMHRQLLAKFRDEDRAIGSVIGEYLDNSDGLLRETPEGRAFDGALELLRNDDLLGELRDNLDVILTHAAMDALTASEARELATTVAGIRQGTDDVLTVRHQLSGTLREHVVSREAAADRELDQLLRTIERELATWMVTARPHARIDVRLLPEPLAIDTLKTRLWDPADDVPPPPLADVRDQTREPDSLHDLLAQGGPSMPALRAALATTTATSASAAFNALPETLRRPVEIIGLLHVLDDTDRLAHADGTDTYHAVRPDGTAVTFTAPRIPLEPQETS